MAIENFDFKEVLHKTIKEGNNNPWATSSTTHHKLVLWLKPLEDDLFFDDEMDAIKEYVRELCRYQGKDGYASEWTIEYYETVYYN